MRKLELGSRFRGRWAKNICKKSCWGAGIIWRSRRKQEKKKIPEPLNTLGRKVYSGVLLSGFYLRRNKRKSKKNSTFSFLLQPGFEPTTFKKWQKRLFRDTPSLVPRSGASPGLRRLSRGRGKCIFKVQLIFIAKNFLIKEPLW